MRLSHPLRILGTMTTSTALRPRQVAQLGPSASTLRLAVTRWALAKGHRMDYDALSVILAAKALESAPVCRWTEDDVWRLWWIDLSGWCKQRGLPTPDGLATTMTTLFAYLEDTDGFAPGSHPSADLRAAMRSAGARGTGPETAHAG